ASTLDLSDVLRLISEQAVTLFNAEAAAIFRAPSSRSGLQQTTAEHYVGVRRTLRDPSVRDAAVQEVIRTGAPQAIDLAYLDGESRLFCLPLRSAREMLGALCIRLSPEAQLTEAELGMLQAFSDAATMAIENASLYQEARHGLETASALLQEMHHRVRNNLQTVAALLSLQARRAGDAPWAVHLNEAVSRIQAIAAVHDLLSDETRLGGTTIEILAQHVASEAHSTLVPPGQHIEFVIEPNDVRVPSRQATIVALLINELVANSVYHGFDGGGGTIRISAKEAHGIATLRVENDGAAFPEGFDPAQSRGLGMRIIQRLVTSDLHGTFHIGPGECGAVAVIEFPLAAEPVDAAAD
ncbi:MAG TPA: histidine kinase dimerization/phosphoacceptor domain -containing protein, partial [Thermomicrobiales bacterium]|nr:histidine kinase dimerization/phosphoacceptor domain -containing protein [Thermomicrobiales bacterium]